MLQGTIENAKMKNEQKPAIPHKLALEIWSFYKFCKSEWQIFSI